MASWRRGLDGVAPQRYRCCMKVAEDTRQNRIPTLDRSGISRYIQLATLFRHRIDSGQWVPARQIPTVEDLAAEFSVARATIRQALGLLESEGLISRFRAKGTFVNPVRQERLWCEVKTDWSGLLTSREGAKIQVLADELDVSLANVPHDIGRLANPYRHLRRRHIRNDKPFLIADLFIDQELAKDISKNDLRTKTALRLAASLPGTTIVDAHQTLTIGAADVDVAEALGLPLNAPVGFVNRSAVDQRGCLVLIAKGIYRGDMVRMDIKLR